MNRATGALMLLIILFFRFCLYDSCPCRYVLCHPDVTAYGRITPDGNPAQNGGIGVYNHVIFQNRMTWNAFNRFTVSIQGEASGTQCHSLIEFHIITDDTCRTNHYTGSMVDREMCADSCSRMYVNTGFAMCHFGDDTGDKRYTQFQKFVGDA